VQAVQQLIIDAYPSSVMKLSRPVLNELARRLAMPGVNRQEEFEWLATKEGGATIKRSSFYRFDLRFREVLKRVTGEWASKLMIAELSTKPEFQNEALLELTKNRVHKLMAQEVMTAESSEDIDTSRLNTILSAVMAHDKGKLEREKLLLLQGQAEHRAAKAEAQIEKLRQDMELKRQHIDEALKTLQTRVKDMEQRAAGGQQIPQSVFDAIRDELAGLSSEAQTPGTSGGGRAA
jgi:hypothetical protein